MSNEPHLTHCTLCGSDFAFCRCLAQRAEDLAAHLRAQAAGQASEIASLRAALAAERKAHVRTTAERDSHRSAVTAPILAMLTAEQRDCYGVEPVVPGSHERDPAQLVTRLCDALSNVEQDRDAAIARAETAERERDEARAACAARTLDAVMAGAETWKRCGGYVCSLSDLRTDIAHVFASDAGGPLLAEVRALRAEVARLSEIERLSKAVVTASVTARAVKAPGEWKTLVAMAARCARREGRWVMGHDGAPHPGDEAIVTACEEHFYLRIHGRASLAARVRAQLQASGFEVVGAAEVRALRAVRDAAEALLVDFSRDDLVWESDRHRIARLRAALDAKAGG